MTKLFTYSFVLFYFLFSIGISANVHICSKKIRSISFFTTSTKSCCGKKKMKKGCCKNVNLVLKKTGSEKINTFAKIQLQPTFFLPTLKQQIEKSLYISYLELDEPILFHPPPNINSTYPSICIKHCTFLI